MFEKLNRVERWIFDILSLVLVIFYSYSAVLVPKVIRGHCAYYGLTGNDKRLRWFRFQVVRIRRKWLARRSRLRCLNWDRMNELLKRYPLPPVSITRSWQRFLSEPVR